VLKQRRCEALAPDRKKEMTNSIFATSGAEKPFDKITSFNQKAKL
jgi:hypothetical protein